MIKKTLVINLALLIVGMNTGYVHAQQKTDAKIQQISDTSNGKTDARNDIKNEEYKYYVIGQPMAHDSIWKVNLKNNYGIELITLGCTPTPEETKYTEEYNKVMIPLLKEKHGDNIMSSSEAKAREEFERNRK